MRNKKISLCILLSLILIITNFPAILTDVNNQGVVYAAQYTVGDAVFTYYEIEGTDNVGISWYVGTDTEIVIPETINGKKVTEITNFAFSNIDDITKITIPKYVSYIEDYALARCDLLEEVVVSEENEYFKSVDGVLFDKTGETLIMYPAAKEGTEYLIPETVKTIYYLAFSACNNIKSIIVPDSVTIIKGSAFEKCELLENIKLSENLTELAEHAFDQCTALKEIKIPDSIKTLGIWTFANCTALERVELPKELNNEVLSVCFGGCSNIKEFYISEDATYFKTVDGVVYDKEMNELVLYPWGKEDKEYTIPYGVKTIGWWSFENVYNLNKVTVSESVTTIEEGAFYGNDNLCEYVIPKSVENIEEHSIGYKWDLENETYKIVDNVVIYGYEDSAVQTYATENNIDFIALSCDENVTVNATLDGEFVNNTEIEVSINISDVENLGGAEIEIAYDSSKLDYISGEVKEAFKSLSNGETSGVVTDIIDDGEKIKISMMYSEGITGNGTVATLKFNILAVTGEKVDLGLSSVLVNIAEYTEISSTAIGTSFIVVEEPEFVYGDVNNDGRINVLDAVLIKKHIAGYENLNIITDACDVNVDGRINVLDAVLVMKKIAGYDIVLGK